MWGHEPISLILSYLYLLQPGPRTQCQLRMKTILFAIVISAIMAHILSVLHLTSFSVSVVGKPNMSKAATFQDPNSETAKVADRQAAVSKRNVFPVV